jgi:hypothetical protein
VPAVVFSTVKRKSAASLFLGRSSCRARAYESVRFSNRLNLPGTCRNCPGLDAFKRQSSRPFNQGLKANLRFAEQPAYHQVSGKDDF